MEQVVIVFGLSCDIEMNTAGMGLVFYFLCSLP